MSYSFPLCWSVYGLKAFQEQFVLQENSAFSFLLERNKQKSQLLPTAPFQKYNIIVIIRIRRII